MSPALSETVSLANLDPNSRFVRRSKQSKAGYVAKKRRCKPPKESKVFKASLAALALRAQGKNYDEIAEILGYTKMTLQSYLKIATNKGWLNIRSFDAAEDRLEIIIKDQVALNLNELINERDEGTGTLSGRAGEVSLEIAKGTGLLKQHQVVKTDQQTNVGVALKVQVEMAPGQPVSIVRPGSIGGTPAIQAEIIDSA